ncbi:MAG TPA: hypothetical protein VMF13_08015 [Luteitalea sp.]|nr:hypothetical protein [Luteitalea sp.]
MAIVGGGQTAIFSQSQKHFARFARLVDDIRRAVRDRRAVLDGDVVCLNEEGRPDFAAFMGRRGTPSTRYSTCWAWMASTCASCRWWSVSAVLRIYRARAARSPTSPTPVAAAGSSFAAACRLDLEGIVSKPAESPYICQPNPWRKAINPAYSQKSAPRFELFGQAHTA